MNLISNYKKKVINWDDTAITMNGKQSCLRFYGTENLVYYKAHLKKKKEGIDNDNIIPYLLKECVVVHDHNKVKYNEDYDKIIDKAKEKNRNDFNKYYGNEEKY